jgi:CubicO group peptidase (beta-lactamase class C family)
MRPEDWPAALEQLDRQSRWQTVSPDRVGLSDLMRIYDVPAASIAVRQGGAQTWSHAYGTTPESIFQACSISKHVAAFGALRLVEQGVLDLDGDIDTRLVSWRLPESGGWRPMVTLRQLLAHTAGLSSNWFRGFRQQEPVPTITEVLRGEPPATSPPVRATMLPGSSFRYSGSHYAVLQQLLEDVTGTGFAELMQSLVLDPLGMAHSSYHQDFPHRHGNVVPGHHVDGTPVTGGWRVQPELAGAGLWTTPSDLCRVGVEIARAATGRSTVLSRELAVEMITPQVPDGYGLGTAVQPLRFGHTGGNVGYSCWLFTWPAADTTMALMLNNDMANEVLWSVLAAADHHYGRACVPQPVASTGAFRVRNGYTVTITDDGGNLALHCPGQPPLRLIPLAEGGFRAAGLDCELTFEDDGTVLRLRQQDMTLTGIRQD